MLKPLYSLLFLITFWVFVTNSSPTPSFIVTSDRPFQNDNPKENHEALNTDIPQITEMKILSTVANRFNRVALTTKVYNWASEPRETTFSVILPQVAYVSGFIMEMNGKSYDALVKEKEEAKQLYGQAVASGLGAAHVEAGARDSNRFMVNVNVEPQSEAVFHLFYDEMLRREYGQYEIIINIHPGQLVKNLDVVVQISESRPLKFVNTAQIRSGYEATAYNEELDTQASINMLNATTATVKFSPDTEKQKRYAQNLGIEQGKGMAGQFVVQYDVERDPNGGEVLLRDGYFVHFFAPLDLPSVSKHVVFVLDTSGSMDGRKIEQLKEAMDSILDELMEDDVFHLVEFNANVKIWNLDNTNNHAYYPSVADNSYSGEATEDLTTKILPEAYPNTDDYIFKAKEAITQLVADGGTNIYEALRVALYLTKISRNTPQPLIIFLTDGEATVGVQNNKEIIEKISAFNNANTPIFSLSFGDGADKNLMRNVSLRNHGFSRHIYEASDSYIQLNEFYNKISSPLLTNVKFSYTEDLDDLTRTEFPALFKGSELVVSGRLKSSKESFQLPKVSGLGAKGSIDLTPEEIQKPVVNLDRFWAYLTVQQLLEEAEIDVINRTAYENKALDLSLKYAFVTPVSSLVVVKPNGTNVIDIQAADDNAGNRPSVTNIPKILPKSQSISTTPQSTTTSFRPTSTTSTISRLISTTPQPTRTRMTPSTTSAPPKETIEVLKENLPWLPKILRGNDYITIGRGTYKLGLDDIIEETEECPVTPNGGSGVCTLLHKCPEVHNLFTNMYIFQQYFCVINNQYAGICCTPTRDHVQLYKK